MSQNILKIDRAPANRRKGKSTLYKLVLSASINKYSLMDPERKLPFKFSDKNKSEKTILRNIEKYKKRA